jgi:transposase InsO family protein
MNLKLHANATTTPRVRAYIQASTASNSALARELGIHSRTVARWRARDQVLDRSTRPHHLATSLTDCEEALIVELRRSLALPLDDITEAMRRCVNPELSRSAIHRCLKRHGVSARAARAKTPVAVFQTDAPAGFLHVDVKYLPPLNRRRSYAYVAIDRATRFVYLEILPDRRGTTAATFLEHLRASFPLPIHTVLTDNGSEFTDRFAVDMKNKPKDKPSGRHPFDRVCAQHHITHRLARPFRPQTNGMVERFNRRLGEHLDRMPQNRAAHHRRFVDHAERDAYLLTFVADYNRTRLRCLGYRAPAELLANLAGHNTCAGAGSVPPPSRGRERVQHRSSHIRIIAIAIDITSTNLLKGPNVHRLRRRPRPAAIGDPFPEGQ